MGWGNFFRHRSKKIVRLLGRNQGLRGYRKKDQRNTYIFVHVLFGLFNLLLLQFEDDLEEVAHGDHHLTRRFLRLDAEEPDTRFYCKVIIINLASFYANVTTT
jgi:hypothetical protein